MYYRWHLPLLWPPLTLTNAYRLAGSKDFVHMFAWHHQQQFLVSILCWADSVFPIEANSLYNFPELLRTNKFNEVSYQQDLIHSKVGVSYRQCTRGKAGVGT